MQPLGLGKTSVLLYNYSRIIMNTSYNHCSHETPPEFRRKQLPRFLDVGETYTMHDVATNDELRLPIMPQEYNSTSPTPLDADMLTIGDIPYELRVELWHENKLHENLGHTDISDERMRLFTSEFKQQQRLRTIRSYETMDVIRKYAAAYGDEPLPHERAEGLMQLYAGIARVTPALELLAAVASSDLAKPIEEIEIFRASRPACTRQYKIAQQALHSTVRSLAANKKLDGSLTTSIDAPAYAYETDENLHTIIVKHRLARLAIRGVDMEILSRETFHVAEPGTLEPGIEYFRKQHKRGAKAEDVQFVDVDYVPMSVIGTARVVTAAA